MILELFLIFIALVFITYQLFVHDFLAPAFLFCVMYTVSIGCALINYQQWGLNDYSQEAFNIYLFGALLFIFVSYLVKILILPNNSLKMPDYTARININAGITVVLTFINLIVLVLWVKNVKTIGGGGSLSQALENYRINTSYSIGGVGIPGYLQQMSKITTASGYIYGFILIYNIVHHTVKKDDYYLCLPNTIIYILFSLFDSNRLNILGVIASYVVYYYFMKNSKGKGFKTLIRLTEIFVVLLIVFYGVRLMVGRSSSKGNSFIEYISMYAGGPVKLFDMFIRDPVQNTGIWGKETFPSLLKTFRSLGYDIPQYISKKEFRFYNGINLGNVYSAYRNWLSDFGINGVYVLQTVFALFYSCYYYLLRKVGYKRHILALIIYGYMAEAIFLHPIDDWLFSMFVSVGFIIYIVVFWLLYIMITKKFKL
ncbi:TPA: oligosaccharide repeat unit polymerase [Candidatus Avigastranaerophilus faecigallinarum]|nr:oligosaccharide repeat unit polymerase [Candidatus Avigastranaerophilus faecigallinarum]